MPITRTINMYEEGEDRVIVFIRGKKNQFTSWSDAFKFVRGYVDEQIKFHAGKN